jgi:outer membrane receptor protein involved in Fe transport
MSSCISTRRCRLFCPPGRTARDGDPSSPYVAGTIEDWRLKKMKLSRTDVPPLTAILAGGLVGFALSGALMDGSGDRVAVHEDGVVIVEPGPKRRVRVVELGEEPTHPDGRRIGHRIEQIRMPVGAPPGYGPRSGAPRPLIYIDGVRVVPDERSLADLVPERIDRVEVVKGSAAVALYGEEAEGGVIRIFTKKGPDGGSR